MFGTLQRDAKLKSTLGKGERFIAATQPVQNQRHVLSTDCDQKTFLAHGRQVPVQRLLRVW